MRLDGEPGLESEIVCLLSPQMLIGIILTQTVQSPAPAATALAAAEKEKANLPVSPYTDQPDTPVLQPHRRPATGIIQQDSPFGTDDPVGREEMEMAFQARKMA
ncbi:hypothetical protein QFC19_001192 [Naganishia cerealis]|uniref:Uncharacterized protein n=1 Tax=Naganishia cerealis TaxID=610337 RepID=A0ACC2WJ50_9TREE|nr:hypothetical protein QFC19_001192 [Naganishia cerealis]